MRELGFLVIQSASTGAGTLAPACISLTLWLFGHLPELLCVAVVLWILAEDEQRV